MKSIFQATDSAVAWQNHKLSAEVLTGITTKPSLGLWMALTTDAAIADKFRLHRKRLFPTGCCSGLRRPKIHSDSVDPQTEEFAETLQVYSLLCFELLATKSQRQFLLWEEKSDLTSPDRAGYFDILLRDRCFIVIVQNTAELIDAWQIMQGRMQFFSSRKIR